MSAVAALLSALLNPALGLPLLVLAVAVGVWVARQPWPLPPRLGPYSLLRPWLFDSVRIARDAAAKDEIAPLVHTTYHRLSSEFRSQYGRELSTLFGLHRWRGADGVSDLAQLRFAVRRLEAAYRYARSAEAPVEKDWYWRWRSPTWNRLARERYSSALDALDPIWPTFGPMGPEERVA